MKALLNYYKWHIFFIALFTFCISAFALSSCTKSQPDLIINCISADWVNVQRFKDTKNNLEVFLHDADGDDKKLIQLNSYTYDIQADLDELMESLANANDSDIVITTKETLENFEDKNLFDTSTNYVFETGTNSEKYDVLKDKNGRVYAVSLANNEYIKNMGFIITDNLYIAVVIEKQDSLPTSKKNARNIAQVILKEGDI